MAFPPTSRRGIVAVYVAAFAVFVPLVVGSYLVLHWISNDGGHLACGFDPTDSCNWSVAVVENDTQRTIRLLPCGHHCGSGDQFLDPITVQRGRRSPASQYGGLEVLTGDVSWIAVDTASGQRLGCLVIDGHARKRDGDLFSVSQMERCGNEHSPPLVPVGHVVVR